MGSKSNYLEMKLLDHVLGYNSSPYTPPATVYIALYNSTPSDTGGGTEVVTTGGTNYERAAVTNNTTNWPTATSPGGVGTKNNGTVITFNSASASWSTVTAFGIFDASTVGGGNLLYWGSITSPKTIDPGDTVSFAASAITITED